MAVHPPVICLKGTFYNARKPLKIDVWRVTHHGQATQFTIVVKTGGKEQKHASHRSY